MTKATIMNFFKAQEQRDNEAKKAKLQAMVDTFGIDEVLETMLAHLKEIKEAVAEVVEEEQQNHQQNNQFEEAKTIISTSKYLQKTTTVGGKCVHSPVEFDDTTCSVFEEALSRTKISVWTKGEGNSQSGRMVGKNFAKFIIKASGNNADILVDIINVLKQAAWDTGHGITQTKLEIVYHAIVLHSDSKADVIQAVTEILKNYDFRSLKVTANQDDRYRNHLSYKEKMMMFVEDAVCERINATPLFNREVATA